MPVCCCKLKKHTPNALCRCCQAERRGGCNGEPQKGICEREEVVEIRTFFCRKLICLLGRIFSARDVFRVAREDDIPFPSPPSLQQYIYCSKDKHTRELNDHSQYSLSIWTRKAQDSRKIISLDLMSCLECTHAYSQRENDRKTYKNQTGALKYQGSLIWRHESTKGRPRMITLEKVHSFGETNGLDENSKGLRVFSSQIHT